MNERISLKWVRAISVMAFIAGALAAPLAAQESGTVDAATVLDVTERAEGAIRSGGVAVETLEALRAELATFRDAISAKTAEGDIAVNLLRAELAELPPLPATGESEPASIAQERARLVAELAEADAPGLADRRSLSRIRVLIGDLDVKLRSRAWELALERGPSALRPETWAKGSIAVFDELRRTWNGLAADALLPTRQAWLRAGLLAMGAFVAIAMAGWLVLMPAVLRRIEARETGPDARARPSRVVLALALRAALSFAFLSLGVVGLIAPFVRPGRVPELWQELVFLPICMTAAHWLAHALFAPATPWRRIVAMGDPEAARATRLVQGLGVVVVLETLAEAAGVEARLGDEGGTVVALVLFIIVAAILWDLGHLLAAKTGAARSHDLRHMLGQALRFAGIGAILAGALGHVALGRAVIDPLLISLWLVGLTVVLHRVILLSARGVLGAVQGGSADAGHVDGRLGASMALTSVASGTVLTLFSAPFHALIWGARWSDLRDGFQVLRDGVDVGGTRLSLGGVTLLVAVFVLGLVITRWMQTVLRFDVLPNTRIDRGGQNAIVTGFGYAGVLLSALVAITMAGIDLASLAIVAGALSVGIGFGLQAIVSNFVSGIILLIERPIKEGDWIEVSGLSGTVRKISVRSTRIETFDGHDVIVPNADLVTGPVRNMTLGSPSGRIELTVGVAYESDLPAVRDVLLALAKDHPLVMREPAPQVLITGTGESAVDMALRCFVSDIGTGVSVRSDLYFSMIRAFAEAGISIPYPVRDLRVTASSMSGRADAEAVIPSK